jgi:hypothetical protein
MVLKLFEPKRAGIPARSLFLNLNPFEKQIALSSH